MPAPEAETVAPAMALLDVAATLTAMLLGSLTCVVVGGRRMLSTVGEAEVPARPWR